MPGNASQRRNVHPLSRTSRRRRRLAAPGELPEIALADTPDSEYPRPVHYSASTFAGNRGLESSRLTRFLARAEAGVWMCVGDSLAIDDAGGSDGGLAACFTSRIRSKLRRPEEIVIDAGFPNCTMAAVREQLRTRVLARQPDAVILTIGPGDYSAPTGSIDEFEEHLIWVLETLHAHEIAVIVATAPDAAGDNGSGLLTIAAVRAITAEQGALHVASDEHAGAHDFATRALAERLVSSITSDGSANR